MSTEPKPKMQINPGLLAALEHFSDWGSMPSDTFFTYTDANGHQTAWSSFEACRVAAEFLADEELAGLKLRALIEGMRRFGGASLYRHIMGQELPAKGKIY